MESLEYRLNIMSRALGIDWTTLLSDQGALREAYAATKEITAQDKTYHPDGFDPFVKDLYTEACASMAIVSVDGRTRFCANTSFAREYADIDKFNQTSEPRCATSFDVLGQMIHKDDQRELFESIGVMLFSNAKFCTEISHIIKVGRYSVWLGALVDTG